MRRHEQERGAVTAEAALALPLLVAVTPLLVAVTLVMVWMVAFGVAQMKTTDAAREVARALARGDSVTEAVALAHQVVPDARVEITRAGGRVLVVVESRVASPVGPFSLGGTTRGEAVALVEEGVGEQNEGGGDVDVPPQ